MTNQIPRFRVVEDKFGAYSSYRLTDSSSGEYATILPYLGGTINNIVFKHKDQLIDILDGYISYTDALQHLHSSFKGSNLFPFPNRIRGGNYTFEGTSYQLNINFPNENNAIHGLVFDQKFSVKEITDGEHQCRLVITYEPSATSIGYPFNYLLEITYKWIEDQGFECISMAKNLGKTNMPVGIGWHPYFKAASDKVDDLSMQFPADKVLEVDQKMIPTGVSKQYNEFNTLKQIDNTQLDHCFVLNTKKSPAEIIIQNNKLNFGYKIWQETGTALYNYLQIYTPPSRTSIAIEPMTCIPDAFNNKQGLIVLKPGKSVEARWGVTLLK